MVVLKLDRKCLFYCQKCPFSKGLLNQVIRPFEFRTKSVLKVKRSELKIQMVTLILILYLGPDCRGVVFLAAQGHEHAIVVGAVSLEDVVRVLTIHQGNSSLDIIIGHILKKTAE